MNDKFERTYEIIDLDDPPLQAGENETHWIYFCPNCEHKHGSPDEKGKLFFDKNELKGICFRCNTAYFPEIKEDETGNTDPKLNHVVATIQKTLDKEFVGDPPPMAFHFGDLGKDNLSYLKGRHPFLPMLAPVLGLKSWFGTKKGIVVPYLYKDYIATFQVRFDTNEHGKRYYIPVGSMKIPYSPEHLLTHFNLGENNNITICEGWADAVALWIMGYPHPLAVQGSIMSDSQIPIIRRLMPDKVFVVMDDWNKSIAMNNDIRKKLPSVSNTQIINFGDDVDPEERLKEDIKNLDLRRKYFDNTMSILRERVK